MKLWTAILFLAACGDSRTALEGEDVIDHDMVIDVASGPLRGRNLTIAAGVTVRFKGDEAAGIIVDGTFTLDGTIDISAGCDDGSPRCPGPGGGIGGSPEFSTSNIGAGGCSAGIDGACAGTTFNNECHGGGGGGGGLEGALGGGFGGGAIPRPVCATFDFLIGGSGGGRGPSTAQAWNMGGGMNPGGGGGGALQIVADTIVVTGTINANGAGGGGGAQVAAGAGGGAGGTLLFQADTVELTTTSVVAANGGGGGGTSGPGEDGQLSANPAAGGPGDGAGGIGGSAMASATAGTHVPYQQSGGGGGAAGLIGIRATTTKLDGVISPTPVMNR